MGLLLMFFFLGPPEGSSRRSSGRKRLRFKVSSDRPKGCKGEKLLLYVTVTHRLDPIEMSTKYVIKIFQRVKKVWSEQGFSL